MLGAMGWVDQPHSLHPSCDTVVRAQTSARAACCRIAQLQDWGVRETLREAGQGRDGEGHLALTHSVREHKEHGLNKDTRTCRINSRLLCEAFHRSSA